MAETTPSGDREKRRERPAHWAHPVDERQREARARRHRRRRVVLVVLGAIVASLLVAYFYLTSDARVESFAEGYLQNLLGTRVRMTRAHFSLWSGLVLEEIRVMAPAPFRDPILEAKRVDLKMKLLSLARLAPEVTEIVVHRPEINLELWNEEVWNFQLMARARPPETIVPRIRPIVAIEDGLLRIRRRIGGEAVYEHQMEVSGLLLPSEASPNTLRFQTDVKSPEVHLAVASGSLDVQTGALRLEGQASNVALSPDLYRSLPTEVQRIWDRFEPSGSVNLKVLFDEQQGFALAAELTGVRFTHRYEGMEHRFENLTGECAFAAAALTLSNVRGLVDGSPVSLDGRISGFSGEHLALDLAITAGHVDAVKSRTALVGLVPHIEALYKTYSPKGQADVDLVIRRGPEADSRLQVSGSILCRDVEMTYDHFPYRLERIRGTVRFGPEGYTADGVEGYHGSARVQLQGWTKNPGSLFESRVTVHAQNVPLDADLRAALPEAQRAVYDQYAPSGTADIDVEVYRPPHQDAPPRIVTTLTLRDARFLYEGFPYPLARTTGKVIIAPGKTELVDVCGRHGDATIRLSGEMVTPDQGEPALHLVVTGTNVALDEDLAKALPPRERSILQVFHLSGRADVEGTIRRTAAMQDALDYDLDIRLNGARMIYEPFPLLVEDVTGSLHLARGACRIERLAGFSSGARIEGRGWIEQRSDDYALDLVLTGKDVMLSESLRGALGPDMRTVWSHLSPRGRVDINAHLTKAFGADQSVRHHVLVTARDAQATLYVFPYPLEHVTGEMEFQGGEVLLHDFRARSGPTEFLLGGRIAYDQAGPTLDLKVRAKGLRLEGPLRESLPGPLQRAMDVMQPTGRVDLNVERLTYRRTASGAAEAAWRGSAILDEVGLTPGIKVTGIVGTAELAGRWIEGRVSLEGQMRIQQGKVADKSLSGARVSIVKHEDAGAVSLQSIEGEFYGGRIEGSASISLTPGGKYTFTLAAADVDFEQLLREGFGIDHQVTGGRLAATLGLWKEGADAKTVEGAGSAQVTGGQLYELPLVVRILNLLRLAPPDRTAFQNAHIQYFIRGRRLVLSDIRLEGRALGLYGAGTMDPDGQLHLTFLLGKKSDNPVVPALAELVEGAGKQLAVVLVTGTLAQPQVELRTLSAVTDPIREFVNLVHEQKERDRKKAAE